MTNYESFMKMNITEFAESRIQVNEDFDILTNDTINTYENNEYGWEQAIKDEIEWLNQEVKEEETVEYYTQDQLSDMWHGMGRSE